MRAPRGNIAATEAQRLSASLQVGGPCTRPSEDGVAAELGVLAGQEGLLATRELGAKHTTCPEGSGDRVTKRGSGGTDWMCAEGSWDRHSTLSTTLTLSCPRETAKALGCLSHGLAGAAWGRGASRSRAPGLRDEPAQEGRDAPPRQGQARSGKDLEEFLEKQ